MKKKLRFWVQCLVIATLVSAVNWQVPNPAQAKDKVFRWKLQAAAPSVNPDFLALKRFAKKVKTASNGRLRITPYSAGAITKGAAMWDGVADRVTEMAMGWTTWYHGKIPGLALVTGGPFHFMNIDAAMMYYFEDEGTKIVNEWTKPHGILWRPSWFAGMEFGILANFPVTGLKDLKGKKIRMGPGLPAETLIEAAGCYAEPTAPEEIYESLQRGVLDGVEWTTPAASWPMKFHEVAPHVIAPAVWQPDVMGDFLINEKAYNELPPDLRQILDLAMRDFTLDATLSSKILDMEAIEKYQAAGVKINTWSDEDLVKWKEATARVYKRHCEKDPTFKRLYESSMKFKKKYYKYYGTFGAYKGGESIPYAP